MLSRPFLSLLHFAVSQCMPEDKGLALQCALFVLQFFGKRLIFTKDSTKVARESTKRNEKI